MMLIRILIQAAELGDMFQVNINCVESESVASCECQTDSVAVCECVNVSDSPPPTLLLV